MKVQVLLCVLAAALIGCQSYGGGPPESDREPEKLSLKSLDRKLSRLTNEFQSIKKVLNDAGYTIGMGFGKEELYDFYPLSISQTTMPKMEAKITLTFKKSNATTPGDFVIRWWFRYDGSSFNKVPSTESSLPGDKFSSSAVVPVRGKENMNIFFGTGKLWWLVNVEFKAGDEVTQSIIRLPLLKLDPPGDVVYQPGTNASFSVMRLTANMDAMRPSRDGEQRQRFVLKLPGINNLVTEYNAEDYNITELFQLGERKEFFDYMETTLKAATAEREMSGVFEISNRIRGESSLVSDVEVTRRVFIRPSTQVGPFPSGFVSFRKQPWQQTSEDGDSIVGCRVNEVCNQVLFEAYGGNIIHVVIYGPDGFPVKPTTLDNLGYVVFASYVFTPKPGDPFQRNFTCMVLEAAGAMTTEKTIVYTFEKPVFVEEKNKVEWTGSQSVTVTCVFLFDANDVYEDNVTVPLQPQYFQMDYSFPGLTVNGVEKTIQTEYRLNDSYVESYWSRKPAEPLPESLDFQCQIDYTDGGISKTATTTHNLTLATSDRPNN